MPAQKSTGPDDSTAIVDVLRASVQGRTDALGVIEASATTLVEAIGADVWCAPILDPSTLLDTGGYHAYGFPEHTMPRLFEIEHVEQDDVDSLRNLARRPRPVSLLSRSTRGQLTRSTYYNDILAPLGLADELRVLLRHGELIWGALVLCRERSSPAFTREDLAAATAIAAPASDALRQALLLTGHDSGSVIDAPGLLMLDSGQVVRSASPTAKRWLDDLQETAGTLPNAVRAIAAHALADPPQPAVRSRARTRSGQWASLHAWRIEADGRVAVAVAIGPADPAELAAIVLDAYGLTQRERQVTQLVLIGRSTAQIAESLRLSTYTVQDHLKSIFTKTGVRSRRDLIGGLFERHYAPQLGQADLSTDGRLLS